MNTRRCDTLDDDQITHYEIGQAIAAAGEPYSHVKTADAELGFDDWYRYELPIALRADVAMNIITEGR